jgi:hypothetical protein
MLFASIVAVTLIGFNVSLLAGLYREGLQGEVRALNYPTTFVHKPGESWAIREDED